jgi:hypothetical protein
MTMKTKSWWMLLGMAVLVVACGDDEEEKPAAQPAAVNKQLAAQTAQSTIAAVGSISDSSAGGSSASSLSSVAQASQNLLTAQAPGTSTKSVASALNIGGEIHPLDLNGPGCTCTETSCTFSNCSAGSSGGSQFTIDGSYSWGGGHIECKNLKYTFGASGAGASSGGVGFNAKVNVTLNCDMTVTATSLKGYMQSAGSSTTEIAGGGQAQGTYSSNWDVKTTFNDVAFGDNKQPTGGSIHVEGTTSVTAAGQSQTFAGSADVTFPVN